MAPLQFLPPLVCLQLERSLAAFCCCAVPTAMLSGLPPVHDCLPSHQCTWNSMKVGTNTSPWPWLGTVTVSGYSKHQGYIKMLWTITDHCIKMLWTITDHQGCIKMLQTIIHNQGYIKMLWTSIHQGCIKMLQTITHHQGYIKMLWTITDHCIKM